MRHSKGISVLILILFIVLVSSGRKTPSILTDTVSTEAKDYTSSYETHESIKIVSNVDFSLQGWPGNGSSVNPYVIEGLEIDGFTTECVYIESTDVYFIIRNCRFEAHWDKNGVTLNSVTHATIENCIIQDCSAGVKLYESPYCTIKDSEISDTTVGISVTSHSDYASIYRNNISMGSSDGIAIYSSPHSVAENNTIFGCRQSGIHLGSDYCRFIGNEVGDFERFGFLLHQSSNGEIRRNKVYHTVTESIAEFDIMLQRCQDWIVEDNLLNGNVRGSIELDRTTGCIISNNSMNRGIFFEPYSASGYYIQSIVSNTVQGKQLGYFHSQNNLALSGNNFGQIILVNCDNVEVSGGTFSRVASTITIESCDNVSLMDLSLVNSFHGINVKRSTNVQIQNCEVDSSVGFGVYLFQSNNLTLLDVHISSTTTGLGQWGRGIYGSGCNHLTISQSSLSNNTPFGIEFSSVTDSTLDEITAEGNYWCDMSLTACLRLTLTDCILESGITFWGPSESAWEHSYSNIEVGGLPFGYFENRSGLTIDGSQYGQIVVVDSDDVEVNSARMNGVSSGVSVVFSYNCSIVDSEISAIERGCFVYKSNHCIVENVELTKYRSTIGLGTQAGIAMYSCDNSIIRDCLVIGLYVGFSINHCNFINVTSCEILRNANGFLLDDCTYCNIIGNQLFHNHAGLEVWSNFTVIYNNEFWNQSSKQAYDAGWYNTWDNGIDTGNAWSDYSGIGVYIIDGPANSTDRYPRLFVPPLFSDGLWIILLTTIGIAGIASIAVITTSIIRRRKSL